MPSVILKEGKYWVGNPKSVFPKWTESPSCTYREGNQLYNAFPVQDRYVAVIPADLIDAMKKQPKGGQMITFDAPFVFSENDGAAFVGDKEV